MKNKAKKGKRKRNLSWIFVPAAILILLIALSVFFYVMKVERIEVTGNYYADRATVEKLVFRSEDDYRLYRVLLRQFFGTEESDVFSDVKVKLTGIQSAVITVRETEAAVMMKLGDTNVFLNKNGIVLGEGAGNLDRLMDVQGFTVLSVTEMEPIGVNDRDSLLDAIQVAMALTKEGVPAEFVLYAGNGTFQTGIGDVTVLLGTKEHMAEKAAELAGQISAYRSLSGIMHLENFSEENRKNGFYFEVVPKEGS